jgi:phospholipase C
MTNRNQSTHERVALLGSASLLASCLAFPAAGAGPQAATPIRHVIVIFQENVSFDHYFATYPFALNSDRSEPLFKAAPNTPAANGLLTGPAAPPNNPTLNVTGSGTVQPFRLARDQATTCDMDHNYTDEQAAYHAGQVDLVLQKLSSTSANCAPDKSTVMGYFDGNTVTALWNYAQHFAMSDNSFNTTYGPSTPGALNLVAGNTHGVTGSNTSQVMPGVDQSNPDGTGTALAGGTRSVTVAGSDSNGNTGAGSIVGDPRPFGDDCNPLGSTQVKLSNPSANVGDLLNAKGITWGWFQGGFAPTTPYAGPGTAAICGSFHKAADGSVKQDYIGHHEPFQYFASTQNLHHLPPSAQAMVGKSDQANHQYDLNALFAIDNVSGASSQTYEITGFQRGVTLPAVTFIKAPGFMDGHAQYSNPVLEQRFLVQVINTVMESKYWNDTAIIIAYDDSDGWYDHVMPPIANPSALTTGLPASSDALTGPGTCGVPMAGAVMGRCGYGPRLPLLVISPFARENYVEHTVSDQSSILRFIEDNWSLGRIDQAAPKSVAQGGSFDQVAGTLDSMFEFGRDAGRGDEPGERDDDGRGRRRTLILDPDSGEVVSR